MYDCISFVAILLACPACSILIEPVPTDETWIVSRALEDVYFSLSGSHMLVIGHDFPTLPDALERLIRRVADAGNPVITVRAPCSKWVPHKDANQHEYWFSWLHRSTATHQYNRVMYAFLARGEVIPRLVEYVASKIQMRPDQDRFFLWSRDIEVTDVMMHPKVDLFVFKVGVSMHPNCSQSLVVSSICFFCRDGQPEPVQLGVYNPARGLVGTLHHIYPDFTTNLRGRFLRGVFLYPATMEGLQKRHDEFDRLYHMESTLLTLAEKLNFTWRMDVPEMDPNATSDYPRPDGTWTGMTGAVLSDEYDFAGCTLWSAEASTVVDYARVFTFNHYTFLSRKPQPAYSWESMIQPYTGEMWTLIASGCLIGSIFFAVILTLQQRFLNPFWPDKAPKSNSLYAARYAFSTLIEENPNLLPTSNTARMFLCLWWVFSMVITCGYDTKLISFLAAPQMEVLPGTFEELVNTKGWKWGSTSPYVQTFRMFVQQSNQPHLMKLIENIQNTDTVEECVYRSINENFVCINLELHLLDYASHYLFQDGTEMYHWSNEDTVTVLGGNTISKHSVLLPVFNRMIQYTWDAGMWAKYMADFKFKAFFKGLREARSQHREELKSMALKIEQLKGPLVLLVAAAGGLGTLALMAEIYMQHRRAMQLASVRRTVGY